MYCAIFLFIYILVCTYYVGIPIYRLNEHNNYVFDHDLIIFGYMPSITLLISIIPIIVSYAM